MARDDDVRAKIADTLNARLADGLDLHSQIEVAHWNVAARHASWCEAGARPSR